MILYRHKFCLFYQFMHQDYFLFLCMHDFFSSMSHAFFASVNMQSTFLLAVAYMIFVFSGVGEQVALQDIFQNHHYSLAPLK